MQSDLIGKLFTSKENEIKGRIGDIRRFLDHPGEKGGGIEEEFRKLLKEYTPDKFEVTSGFVFDSYGNKSKQIDIIIYDKNSPFKFYYNNSHFVPVEYVYYCFEVKTRLDINALDDAFKKMSSVKELKKRAFLKNYHTQPELSAWGRIWNYFPLAFGVIGIESIDAEKILRKIHEEQNGFNNNTYKKIDNVLCLDKGVFHEKNGDSIIPLSVSDSRLSFSATENRILLWIYIVTRYLIEIDDIPVTLEKYLDALNFAGPGSKSISNNVQNAKFTVE